VNGPDRFRFVLRLPTNTLVHSLKIQTNSFVNNTLHVSLNGLNILREYPAMLLKPRNFEGGGRGPANLTLFQNGNRANQSRVSERRKAKSEKRRKASPAPTTMEPYDAQHYCSSRPR
jgi:hypothetical protein